jgi:hypothetical protein
MKIGIKSYVIIMLLQLSCSGKIEEVNFNEISSSELQFQKHQLNVSDYLQDSINILLKEHSFIHWGYLSIHFDYKANNVFFYDGNKLQIIDIKAQNSKFCTVGSSIKKSDQHSFIVSSGNSTYLAIYNLKSDITKDKLFYLFKYNENNNTTSLIDTLIFPQYYTVQPFEFKASRTLCVLDEVKGDYIINSNFNNIFLFQNSIVDLKKQVWYNSDIITKKLYKYNKDSISFNDSLILKIDDFASNFPNISFGESIAIHNDKIYFKDNNNLYWYDILKKEMKQMPRLDIDVMDYHKYGFYKFNGLWESKNTEITLDLYYFH